MFFKNSLRDIEDELREIDPARYPMYLGPLLPGEEIICEMNDLEKKAFIWNALMAEEMKKVLADTNSGPCCYNEEKAELVEKILDNEFKILLAKSDALRIKVVKSILHRINPEKPIAFRGNFQIVSTTETKENRDARKEKLYMSILTDVQNLIKKHNVKQHDS